MQQSHLASLGHTGRGSIAPTSNDVLFGRGKRFQNHPGNLRMRKIIRKYKKIYSLQKGQHKKRLVVENAYNEIANGGARFIKQSEDNKNEWVEVMMHEALEKVAHTIRYKPRGSKDGSSGKEEEDSEESSVDEQPVNMAANTVVLTRDQPASSLLSPPPAQLSSSEAAHSPSLAYGNQLAGNQGFNSLLNSTFAQQRVNPVMPPISLLDVYVNPINRPFLNAGLLSPTSYNQNLLLGGLGNSGYCFNQATQNANLTALTLNQANLASHQHAMMLAQQMQQQQQQSKKEDAEQKPQGKEVPENETGGAAEQERL